MIHLPVLMTAYAVGVFFGLEGEDKETWVYRHKDEIGYHQIGRLVRFDQQDVLGYLQRTKVDGRGSSEAGQASYRAPL